uniref:ATP synthase subunit a n=1 Tax=Gondogeneia antarctica TaxID=1109128 RepID=G8IQP7_GONAN|nr:ATP synthase F0 subunit 6 [Gondogeneia antarctica]
MMTNLFSIFDPSTPNFMSSNWISIFSFLLFMPLTLWVSPSRLSTPFNMIIDYVLSEFKPLIKKSPYVLLISLSFFTMIVLNNVAGLLPYIFTATSHLTLTLSLALPIWSAIMLYGLLNNMSNILVHLIPQGTPFILMPFMVVIETISNLIRPITLAVRLTANMIAGHLLVTLLMSSTPLTPLILTPVLFMAQMGLASLELAVAFIQAYVFSVLITLYAAEASN